MSKVCNYTKLLKIVQVQLFYEQIRFAKQDGHRTSFLFNSGLLKKSIGLERIKSTDLILNFIKYAVFFVNYFLNFFRFF